MICNDIGAICKLLDRFTAKPLENARAGIFGQYGLDENKAGESKTEEEARDKALSWGAIRRRFAVDATAGAHTITF